MSTYLAGDKKMLEAYNTGKDLYAMIAASALGITYEECLEFWPEGAELEIGGEIVTSGSGKTFEVQTDENDSITIKNYELLETSSGEKEAKYLAINDKISSNKGELIIKNIVRNGVFTIIYF